MNEIVKNEQQSSNQIKNRASVKRKKPKAKKKRVVLWVLIVVMAAITLYLFVGTIRTGAEALVGGYYNAYSSEKEEAYQEQYEKFFEMAEEQYHVSNRGSISIGNIKESQKLEVLKVSDVEYVIGDKDSNSGQITSWLEVPGEGTYVVDLQAAEFIIDNERAHVLIRVPYPELTNVTIDYKNVEKLLFKNGVFNDSYTEGEDLARQQLTEADILIKKEFASNQNFYLTAQDTAKTSLEYLVRQMNPDEEELTVDVEFY